MIEPRYLLDTDICIYIAKHCPPEVRRRFDQTAPEEFAVSLITFGELRHGADQSRSRDQALATLTALGETITVLPLPADAGTHYGEIRATLERAGTPIGNNDLWIAAHARSANLTLVTNNEFGRIDKLHIENWTSPVKV